MGIRLDQSSGNEVQRAFCSPGLPQAKTLPSVVNKRSITSATQYVLPKSSNTAYNAVRVAKIHPNHSTPTSLRSTALTGNPIHSSSIHLASSRSIRVQFALLVHFAALECTSPHFNCLLLQDEPLICRSYIPVTQARWSATKPSQIDT